MKISILTPSFNSGKYIERAIQSVLNQDYDNWEHIIIDGGSTDGTIDTLKRYDHLKWISEPDKGQSDAMNKAFKKSKGGVIVYLNADDWLGENVFAQVIKSFSEKPKTEIVIGNLTQVFPEQEIYRDDFSTSLIEILDYWPCRFPLNPVSYFYKRKIQEKIGDFPDDNPWSMDYWFLLRVFRICKYIVRVNSLFGYYFIDRNTKSSNIERAINSLKKTQKEFLIEHPMLFFKYYTKRIFKSIGSKYMKYKISMFRSVVGYLK